MEFKTVEKIAELTKSLVLQETSYKASVFKQYAHTTADGEVEITEEDTEREIQLMIPVHSFSSFITLLLELRKDFTVGCAYTKEPMNYGDSTQGTGEGYTFSYYDAFYQNVLFSYVKEANVFIFLRDFDYYANLSIKLKELRRK